MQKYNKGQSLFELIISIGISALVVTAVVTLATKSIQNSNYSKSKSMATAYAQQATEWLREQRDADITVFSTKSSVGGTTWCLNDITPTWNNSGACSGDEIISETLFLRQVVLNTSTVSSKTQIAATVTVTWTDSKGIHIVTDATNFSDLRQR